jgi:hypothetical protein
MRDVMRRFILDIDRDAGVSFKRPAEDLVAVIDGASWGLMEQALLDPSQARVFELFIKLIEDAAVIRTGS